MRSSHILLLCILGHALVTSVFCNNAIGPNNCCFKPYYPRPLHKRYVQSYYMTDYRCAKNAAILVTKKSRNICVDPNLTWVETMMKSLDESTF
ncbi:C-C motif chemokine 4-like [Cottoperca gobio]|uniref:C-C motif chemokine 4-like n=1 Tax=Cottoperca gobio TaxID=56716 RepID=A0A6J2RKA6_COTGO|nr:C-C motif chemokine 4-like [Cottoperca gobio]